MGIRWRKKDEEILKKKVNNYNAKINRLKKKNYDGLIPDKINYNQLKDRIVERADFNAELKVINMFTSRGSEKIVSKNERNVGLSRFHQEMIDYKLKELNVERKKLKKELTQFPDTDRGKLIQGERTVKYATEQVKEREFNFKYMNSKTFESYVESLDDWRKTKRESYNKLRVYLDTAYSNNLTEEQYAKLKPLMNQLSTQEIIVNIYKDSVLTIKFVYEKGDQENQFNGILEGWQQVIANRNKKSTYQKEVKKLKRKRK